MKDKALIISILCTLISFSIHAQEPEYETVFSKKAMRELSKIRFYGIVNTSYMPLYKNNKRHDFMNLGFDAGITIKKRFGVGIFYQSIGEIKADFRPNYPQKPDLYTYLDNYGLSLTYTHKPQNAAHLFYNLKVGQVGVTELIVQKDEDYISNFQKSFMVSPAVGFEMNLFPWMAANLSLGYRFVAPKTALGLEFGKDLRGSNLQFGIKIGNIR
jgi:hypothetical protein